MSGIVRQYLKQEQYVNDPSSFSQKGKYTNLDGLSCSINGQETFFETYFDEPSEITKDCNWITPDLTDEDTAISFISGADFAAGACIGLISIALIDKSQALIYYLDDEMKYSREMLVSDTPQFLNELEKQKNSRKP